jgi:hypothetical protein
LLSTPRAEPVGMPRSPCVRAPLRPAQRSPNPTGHLSFRHHQPASPLRPSAPRYWRCPGACRGDRPGSDPRRSSRDETLPARRSRFCRVEIGHCPLRAVRTPLWTARSPDKILVYLKQMSPFSAVQSPRLQASLVFEAKNPSISRDAHAAPGGREPGLLQRSCKCREDIGNAVSRPLVR